jgi:hypothetical protein
MLREERRFSLPAARPIRVRFLLDENVPRSLVDALVERVTMPC